MPRMITGCRAVVTFMMVVPKAIAGTGPADGPAKTDGYSAAAGFSRAGSVFHIRASIAAVCFAARVTSQTSGCPAVGSGGNFLHRAW